MKHTKGFTILELLVAMGLLVILCGFGFPAYQHLIAKEHANSVMIQLYRAVQWARSEAIRHNAVVTLAATDGVAWQNGYRVFLDTRADGVLDLEDRLIKSFPKIKGEGHLRWKGFPNKSVLQFLPTGFTNYQNGTFYYESPIGVRTLIISKTGRVRFGD